jgi:hypothetical protein
VSQQAHPILRAFWFAGILVVGVLIGRLAFPEVKFVDRRVEVVKTVETQVAAPAPAVGILSTEHKDALSEQSRMQEAAQATQIAFGPTAIMPLRNRVRVIVIGPEAIFTKVSRDEVQRRVEEGFRSKGLEVVDIAAPSGSWNTTAFANLELMMQEDSPMIVGSVQLRINQTLVCFSDGVWRKANFMANDYSMTISYGTLNYGKIPEIYDGLVAAAAADLIKADGKLQQQTSGRAQPLALPR